MAPTSMKARCKVCVRHCCLVLTVTEGTVTDVALDPDAMATSLDRGPRNSDLCRRARGLKGKSVQEACVALQGQELRVIRLY